MPETVHIEGDTAEGGGQILRTSLALAALTGRPLEIVRIRHRRHPPGLKAQHLAAKARPVRIRGVSSASQDLRGRRVAERQAEAARRALREGGLELPVSLREEYAPSASPGSALVLWAEGGEGPRAWRLGADRLGARGLPAEEVGAAAARLLLERLARPEPVEEHLADHLVPLLALLGGRILCQERSGHVQANLYVAERFSGLPALREGNLVRFPSGGR